MAIHTFNNQEFNHFLLKYDELEERTQSVLYKSKDKKTLFKMFIYPKNLKEEELKESSKRLLRKLVKLTKIKQEGYREKVAKCIAFPIDIVIVDEICVGYTMEFFEDAETTNVYIQNHSDMSCIDRLKLCIQLCKKIDIIHMYFVIGDCHIEQFMVGEDGEIFLIDTDTFGIRKYDIEAEKVRILKYADPLALDKSNNITRYRQENDWYSTAIIIFKIMVNGKSAFSGKYNNNCYKPEERMKMRVSIFHNEGINLKGFNFKDFAWMSIEIQKIFIQIFENDERDGRILWKSLEKLLDDLAYCKDHELYYCKSRYSHCPQCCMDIDKFHNLFRNMLPYTGQDKRATKIQMDQLLNAIESEVKKKDEKEYIEEQRIIEAIHRETNHMKANNQSSITSTTSSKPSVFPKKLPPLPQQAPTNISSQPVVNQQSQSEELTPKEFFVLAVSIGIIIVLIILIIIGIPLLMSFYEAVSNNFDDAFTKFMSVIGDAVVCAILIKIFAKINAD